MMLNNISILTEDQLDAAVDELVEHILEYVDTYDYDVDKLNADFVIQAADGIGVNPTPQVVDVALYRIQAMS